MFELLYVSNICCFIIIRNINDSVHFIVDSNYFIGPSLHGLFIGFLKTERARAKLIYWTDYKKPIIPTEVQLARSR